MRYIRSHLWLKLFLTYLAVILVGLTVLAVGVSLAAPQAYNRHMLEMGAGMEQHMGQMMGGQGRQGEGIYANFRAAVMEALKIAGAAAVAAAGLASLLVARQVVAPVQAMQAASQRIAQGNYSERVDVPENMGSDELGELAISFNQMAEKLEQTESMRRQLIGDVAHELRTPLTVIKGSVEGLMDGVLPADAETFQQIFSEADRLNRLVDDLQELSRVEAGAYELRRQPCRADDVILGVVKNLRGAYDEKGVMLRAELDPELPDVLADPFRLTQVLTNLLNNALQFTPGGGKVEVEAEKHSREMWISVRDNGAGIPAEHLEHIFSRFYRVDKSRARAGGGSGIGLTIARHLVEAHGGRIWAESPGSGQGSTFTFSVPLA